MLLSSEPLKFGALTPFFLHHPVFNRKDDLEVGFMLLSQARKDGVTPNLVMSRCIIGKFNCLLLNSVMILPFE